MEVISHVQELMDEIEKNNNLGLNGRIEEHFTILKLPATPGACCWPPRR